MRLVAVTGGIASGKSTFVHALSELGATVVDADAMARDAVDHTTAAGRGALERIAARFGAGILTAEGALDRGALGDVIFENAVARADLNAILHPVIMDATTHRLDALNADPTVRIVVHEIPLLTTETGPLPWTYDAVVVVTAPAEERVRRLVASRGLSETAARTRIAAQPGDEARLPLADQVVDTGAGSETTTAAAHRVWIALGGVPEEGTP